MAKFRMQAYKPGKFHIHYKRKYWPFWQTFRVKGNRLKAGYTTIYEDVWLPWTGTESEAQRFINDLTKRDQVYK